MNVLQMALREIGYRKRNFLLAIISISAAVASFVASATLLENHHRKITQIHQEIEAKLRSTVEELQKGISDAVTRLGFDIIIIPREQDLTDWHTENYASKNMPEEYATKLAGSNLLSIKQIVPRLRKKIRWTEKGWTVIIVGVGNMLQAGKESPDFHITPPERSTVELGHELHTALNIKAGDKIHVLNKEFTVSKCLEEKGNQDDITIWMHLEDAQNLLDCKGVINEILAVECRGAWQQVAKIREEINKILPDTQIIEKTSHVITKAQAILTTENETRASLERESNARIKLMKAKIRIGILLALLSASISIAWLVFLTITNVRSREQEIGILSTLGYSLSYIMGLFVIRLLLVCISGCILGYLIGRTVPSLHETKLIPEASTITIFVIAIAIIIISGIIPVIISLRRDPSEILNRG